MSQNVLNYFEQPSDASGQDNKAVFGGSVETSGGANLKAQVVNLRIEDVSSAGQVYAYMPYAGSISRVTSVLNGAISVSDATLTVKTASGTAGTITIANAGSAAGDVDFVAPVANNSVAAGALIEIETDGASTGAVGVDLAVEFLLS